MPESRSEIRKQAREAMQSIADLSPEWRHVYDVAKKHAKPGQSPADLIRAAGPAAAEKVLGVIFGPTEESAGPTSERERRLNAAVERVLRRALDGYRENHYAWAGWTDFIARGRAVRPGDTVDSLDEITAASICGAVRLGVYLELPGCRLIGDYNEGWPFEVYGHAMVAAAAAVRDVAPPEFVPADMPPDAPHCGQPNEAIHIVGEFDRQCGSPAKAQDVLREAIAIVRRLIAEARKTSPPAAPSGSDGERAE